MTSELHIGVDGEKIVVSPRPIKMRSGRARRIHSGSVTEVVPVAPSGRGRPERTQLLVQLALVLLILGAVLSALGIPWWAAAAGSAVLLVGVWGEQARAARPALLALPGDEDSQVLRTWDERLAYEKAVVVSRRIRRTWPELPDLIDPVEADRSLTRALGQLAALLARRQEIRRVRADLTDAARAELPADSPARQDLAAQRERVEALWRQTGQAAIRMLAGLNAAALAGEAVLREERTSRAARAADRAISRLTTAERGAAVVDAYRELAAL